MSLESNPILLSYALHSKMKQARFFQSYISNIQIAFFEIWQYLTCDFTLLQLINSAIPISHLTPVSTKQSATLSIYDLLLRSYNKSPYALLKRSDLAQTYSASSICIYETIQSTLNIWVKVENSIGQKMLFRIFIWLL